jgi:hypothetical protein
MNFSKHTIETLLDLVEVKLSCMQVLDREDAREMEKLEGARRDLLAIKAVARPVKAPRPALAEALPA